MTHALEKPADRLLFILTLLLVFMMSARAPVDTDMWWALRVGREIVTEGSFIHTDPITYTFGGEPWVSHSWLFDVVLYAMFSWLRYHGLTLLVALLAAAISAVMWFQLRGPAIFRTLMVVFAGLIAAPTWTPRPQMISMLLLCLTYLILFLYRRDKKRRLLLFIPPMMILWANLHGGYILGLVAIGSLVAGEIGDHLLLNTTDDSLNWLQIRDLGFLFVISLLVTLITPYGFGTWEISFSTFNMQVNDFIWEWQSPDFHADFVFPYFMSLLILVGLFMLSNRKRPAWDAVITVIFVYFSLSSMRQIGAYSIAVIPVIGRSLWLYLDGWWSKVTTYFKERQPERWEKFEKAFTPKPSKENKVFNLVVVGLFALTCWAKLIYVSLDYLVEDVLNPSTFPVEAVEVMNEIDAEGQLFNEYDWGGYLSWWAMDTPIYIDARADLFGDEFIFQWNSLSEGREDWQDEFAQWGITQAMIRSYRPLAKELENHPDWDVVYSDELVMLLLKNIK